MKKMIFLMLIGTLFTASSVFAYSAAERFLEDVNDEIFEGIQSGDLTRNEVKQLRRDLIEYQWTIWAADENGRITRNEKRQLESMERRLVDKLDAFLYNRNRANRNIRQPRYRNDRTPNRAQARRNSGSVYCPPPRRYN